MIRKTLTILSLVGLVLSVGMWGVSYFNVLHVGKREHIGAISGGFQYHSFDFIVAPGSTQTFRDGKGRVFEIPCSWVRGFGLSTKWLPAHTDQGVVWGVFVPLWIPTAVFGFTFYFSFLHGHHRRHRRKLGLCVKCGYDLRGSKDRCPECGRSFQER